VPTALVTGATGLVGMHLVPRLRRGGWSVRAMVRDVAHARTLGLDDVSFVAGDVLDAEALSHAAQGCDALFHAAAVITPRGGWEAYRRPNVDGTTNAIAAASAAGARLVHVSSVAVYGATGRYAADGRPTDESTPPGHIPDDAYYARSKRESEALVLEAQRTGRVWATAVRPCVLYGPHDRQFVPRIARLLRFGVAPVIAGGANTLAIVHAANVADGLVRAAEHDGANGRVYNLANDDSVTARAFFELAAEGMGRRVRIVSVPWPIARAAFAAIRTVAPLVMGDRFTSTMSASLDFLGRDNPFSSERARRELGWNPPVDPLRGIVESFRWATAHR
jgi:nucleoside-diphosphate-sugar epimerase